MLRFLILTTLNPNAVNPRYGRPLADCDIPRQADPRDVIYAESRDAAFALLNGEDAPFYGFPEREFAGLLVTPDRPLADEATARIAGGEDPDGLCHEIEGGNGGLSSCLPAGSDLSGYTSRYRTLREWAKGTF